MSAIAHSVVFGVPGEVIISSVSALFVLAAIYLFLLDIRRGKVRPYLLAWTLRIGLVLLAFLVQLADGATYSLALSGAQLLGGSVLLAYMYARQGKIGSLDITDYVCLALAVMGMTIWMLSGQALFAALGVIAAEAAATAMVIRAAVTREATESMRFWLCCLVAATAAVTLAAGMPLAVVLIPLASLVNALANIFAIAVGRLRSRQRLEVSEA